jgi:uncharacterized protein YhjY with autotransporter beta-barrel domain
VANVAATGASVSGSPSASVKIGNFSGGISNSGMIAAGNAGIWVGGAAADFSSNGSAFVKISNFSGGISNSGMIIAGAESGNSGLFVTGVESTEDSFNAVFGTGNGIFVGGIAQNGGAVTISTFAGGISNAGTILAAANGIWVGGVNSGGAVTISNFSGGITNSGTVVAGGDGIIVGTIEDLARKEDSDSVHSFAMSAPYTVSNFSGSISNAGTIVAGNTGILVSGVSNFSGGITNIGSINGFVGIVVANSNPVSMFDSGYINGTSGTALDLTGNAPGNTFTLGPGYSISGQVLGQGNDTFQLGGTGTGNFNLANIGPVDSTQQFQGFTTFNVVSGVWNTSGTFDIGMPSSWTVQGGTLAGASTFGTSANPVSIVVANGGTLEPGTPGQPGTFMTITGDLTLQPGANYEVNINSSTASRANVTGSVFLNGTVEGVLTPGSYSGTTVYDILDPERIVGEFTRFVFPNAPGFGGALHEDADPDVMLQLRAQLGSGDTLNQNQQNVASSINNFFNNGGTLPAGFFPLFTLTGGNLTNALTQLDGEDATGAERAAFGQMNQFLGLMLDPFVFGRGGNGSAPALGFARDEQAGLPADVALAYARILKAPAARPAPFAAALQQRWTVWASGFGGSATTNGDPIVGSNNLTTSTYGYAAGMDYHYSPNTVLGFSLAGGGSNWNLANALGTGTSDSFLAGVYGITHQGPWYVGGALAFANNWFTTNRSSFAGDQLSANFQGQDYAARLEGGYRFAVPLAHNVIGVTPYAAVQTQNFHTPAYSETDLSGGGFGLSYNAMSGTDTRSELGGRFDDLAALGIMPVMLRAKLAWAHDWASNPALNASFEALPGASFTVNGAPIPQDSALTSVGAQLWFMPNWSLLAKFDGEFASGSQILAGSGTLRHTW